MIPDNLRWENLLYFYNTHKYCVVIGKWVVRTTEESDCTMCQHEEPNCYVCGGNHK